MSITGRQNCSATWDEAQVRVLWQGFPTGLTLNSQAPHPEEPVAVHELTIPLGAGVPATSLLLELRAHDPATGVASEVWPYLEVN